MALSKQQVDHFHEHGYVIVPDVVTEADLGPVIGAIDAFIDERARRLQAEGQIQDLHEGEPFERRIALLQRQHAQIINGMDIFQAKLPEVFRFMMCDNLLDAVESLVGPHITLNPIQHLRPKVPKHETAGGLAIDVPWHQDIGVMWEEADDSNVVTCWMPLIDATRQTGCMAILPDVHKRGYLEHEAEGGSHIRPDQIEGYEPIIAECPRRGAVFMTRYTPHSGLPNTSDVVRWTLDLRFQPTGVPTGRPFLPAFVVRDPDNPAREQRDYDQWCQRWDNALQEAAKISLSSHRTAPKQQRVWTKGQV